VSKEYCPNPVEWIDMTLTRHWSELEQALGKDAMPVELESVQPVSANELGCGDWGCVYRTGNPGVILKVTQDQTEAMFASHAITIGTWPPGMVRYWAVYQDEPRVESFRGVPTFFLWREEAKMVGEALPEGEAEFVWSLREFLNTSRHGLYYPLNNLRVGKSDVETAFDPRASAKGREEGAVRAHALLRESQERQQVFLRNVARSRRWALARYKSHGPGTDIRMAPEHRFALNILHCENIARDLAMDEGFGEIGEAMLYYMAHGMVLADVRSDNIGLALHARHGDVSAVITDPGGMTPIRPDRLQAVIPLLGGGHAVAAWPQAGWV